MRNTNRISSANLKIRNIYRDKALSEKEKTKLTKGVLIEFEMEIRIESNRRNSFLEQKYEQLIRARNSLSKLL